MSAPFPLPDADWGPTRPFWEGAARKELRIPRCADCGAWNWYPPERCRRCAADSLAWEAACGRGTLFTWSVVRRAWVKPFEPIAPYATGLVALEEDPAVRLVTLLVDCEPEDLRMEMPLEVVFRELPFPDLEPRVVAPLFRPAG